MFWGHCKKGTDMMTDSMIVLAAGLPKPMIITIALSVGAVLLLAAFVFRIRQYPPKSTDGFECAEFHNSLPSNQARHSCRAMPLPRHPSTALRACTVPRKTTQNTISPAVFSPFLFLFVEFQVFHAAKIHYLSISPQTHTHCSTGTSLPMDPRSKTARCGCRACGTRRRAEPLPRTPHYHSPAR